MKFKVNCERCGALLSKGKVHNYSDENLCEDCYILRYMFSRKAAGAYSPNVMQLHRGNSSAVVLQLSAKR